MGSSVRSRTITLRLSASALHNGGFRERADHIQMNRADFRVPPLSQIINARFDILSCRSKRHKYRVRVFCLILGNQAVVAARQRSEIFIGIFQERENWLGEIVSTRYYALHVMLLILHGAEKHGIRQVDHARHAPPFWAKQNALAFRRTIDDVVRSAQIFAHQFRFVLVESALKMRSEKSILHVHSGSQAEFGHAAQDERLIGRLLSIFSEQDDPPRVERTVDIVMPAMDIQRVLGKGASTYLQNHCRALARRVIILLHAVHDSLARRKIDDALAADRVRDGSALRRMLTLRFDGNGAVAEDIQFAFRVSLLIKLAAFGGRGDRIEDSRVGDPGFRMIGDQLISVGGYANAGVTWLFSHVPLLERGYADCLPLRLRHSARPIATM